MDFDTLAPDYVSSTTPPFMAEAEKLRAWLSALSPREVKELMRVSDELAKSVVAMYQNTSCSQPAAWAYVGDVFKGFQAASLDKMTAEYAQQHLLIPSGLYGLLRPFDCIQPYRLEMKAKLAFDSYRNLYDIWGDQLGKYITADNALRGELLVLSSQEYARAVTPYLDSAVHVVTPAFIDKKPNGVESQVAIYNKMMRGVMARWIVDARIDSFERLQEFSAHGYSFSPERSTTDRPVFYRHHMTPLIFT